MDMAEMVATWSKDPNTKIGAVLVSGDRRHISIGYNGFPRGIADDHRLLDRDLKRQMMEHAERNCFHNCPFDPHGLQCTLYVNGDPCLECAKAIIQNGVVRVVFKSRVWTPQWQPSLALAMELLKEAKVLIHDATPEPKT